jgi:hypothetical protein
MRDLPTVNHELKILKQVFNKAAAWGLTDKNPAAKVKKLPEPPVRTRFRPILMVALVTGLWSCSPIGSYVSQKCPKRKMRVRPEMAIMLK